MNRVCIFLTGILIVLNSVPVFADQAEPDDTPFYTRNMNPFIQVYGLPGHESGGIIPPGKFETRVIIDAANSYAVSNTGNEKIILDGETNRVNVVVRYGFSERFELGIDLPYIFHQRGVFDDFIEGWHDFFDLPEGDRKSRGQKILEYHYERNGRTLHRTETASSGPGDLLLSGSTEIFNEKNGTLSRTVSLRTSLKLPTGSAAKLHGSGGTDFSLRLANKDLMTLADLQTALWGSIGILIPGKGKVLDEIRKDLVFFSSLGISRKLFHWLTLKIQFDGHSPFYASDLDELGRGALQLNLGGTVSLGEHRFIDLNVKEDLFVDASPDIVFHIAIRELF